MRIVSLSEMLNNKNLGKKTVFSDTIYPSTGYESILEEKDIDFDENTTNTTKQAILSPIVEVTLHGKPADKRNTSLRVSLDELIKEVRNG